MRTLGISIAVAAALAAFPALAAPKDGVTIGMTLEPTPGLDPTSGAAAAIGEIVHYNIFEGLTKINEDFSITPLLADKWSFSPDLIREPCEHNLTTNSLEDIFRMHFLADPRHFQKEAR